MAKQDTYQPLISEILRKVNNAKTKAEKTELLQKYNTQTQIGRAHV